MEVALTCTQRECACYTKHMAGYSDIVPLPINVSGPYMVSIWRTGYTITITSYNGMVSLHINVSGVVSI